MPSRLELAAVGDTTISILLLANPRELARVDVRSRATRPPALDGFEERMRARKKGAGSALFITAAATRTSVRPHSISTA